MLDSRRGLGLLLWGGGSEPKLQGPRLSRPQVAKNEAFEVNKGIDTVRNPGVYSGDIGRSQEFLGYDWISTLLQPSCLKPSVPQSNQLQTGA